MKFFKSKFSILLFFVLFIRVIYSIYLFNFKYLGISKNEGNFTIIEKYKETEKTISYYAKLNNDTFIIYVPKEFDVLNKKDVIKCSYKVMESEFLNNYNEFNYDLYLKSTKVVGRLYITDMEVIKKSNSKSYVDDFKDFVKISFESRVSGLIISIITGDKELLDDDLKELFNLSGISHILVVSGSAIFILRKFIRRILKKVKFSGFIELIIIILYVLFCKFSISIFRAFLIYFLSFIFSSFKKNKSKLYYILLSMLILLIINPYYTFNTSFWYSNLATLGITLIMPSVLSKLKVIHLKLYRQRNDFKLKKRLRYNFEKYILNSISLTLSVQIILFPLNIYLGNSVYLLSFISNFIINILYTAEYIISFLLIIFFKVPYLNSIICYVLNIITKMIINLASFFSKFSFLSININKMWLISIIILYVIIIYFFYGYIIKFKLKYKFKSIKKFNIFFKLFWLIMIFLLIINIYFSYFAPFVYYFNVGQGNMSVLRCGGKVVIFDMGSSTNDVKSILLNFLKAYNIKKIDYIFLSHMHSDHINVIYSLEDEIKEGKITIGAVCANSLNEKMSEFLKDNNIEFVKLKRGDEFRIGKIDVNVLSPENANEIASKDMLNANSMVTSFKINGKSMLFMGDATKETESVLTNIIKENSYYILQVGHHGSSTSTTENFLDKFSFKYAVISSKKSAYGHPADIVTLNLYKHNIKFTILEERGGLRFWL